MIQRINNVKNRLLFFFISFICPTFLSAQVTTNLYDQADKQAMAQWVDSLYSKMTLDEKVGQLFMPIVEPNSEWKTRISGYIRNQKVGGLLFSKGSLVQQASITNYAQQVADLPLLISLDGEWGLSMRLTDRKSVV